MSVARAQLSPRERRQTARRKEIRKYCAETVRRAGREPSVLAVQRHLKELEPRQVWASYRTVWKDMTALRAEAGKGIPNGEA